MVLTQNSSLSTCILPQHVTYFSFNTQYNWMKTTLSSPKTTCVSCLGGHSSVRPFVRSCLGHIYRNPLWLSILRGISPDSHMRPVCDLICAEWVLLIGQSTGARSTLGTRHRILRPNMGEAELCFCLITTVGNFEKEVNSPISRCWLIYYTSAVFRSKEKLVHSVFMAALRLAEIHTLGFSVFEEKCCFLRRFCNVMFPQITSTVVFPEPQMA